MCSINPDAEALSLANDNIELAAAACMLLQGRPMADYPCDPKWPVSIHPATKL